jgi:hypothetical protein
MHSPERTVRVEVDRPCPHDRRGWPGADPRDDSLEPAGERDVVGVHPRDVCAPGDVEAAVQRPRETQRFLVPENTEPRVTDRRERIARSVDRAVVDDDQLEIVDRLPEDAVDSLSNRRLGVACGEDDGHEGRGHCRRRVACGGGGRGS